MNDKRYFVYIVTNKKNRVLYIGVTNNIMRRIYQHKQKKFAGFTQKYNATKLVYFEETNDVSLAITREKQLKGWRREKKINLIESMNPEWNDLLSDY